MNRLLIIDGHNLHFQIFFGIRARMKKKPKSVSPFGVGFTGAIKRIIRAANATHVLVIFDGEHENPRRALLPTYKANRPDYSLLPDDENPYLQLPAVYKALENLKIKYIETTEVEADDLIAICTERYRNAADITVCSHDHDFYQLLVGGKVRLMRYSTKHAEFYDERAFREEFHISPRRFADYKALTGDKSDNIPGVRGVGNISASRLIGQFGGIESIIERAPEIRQKKLRRCVIEGIERMRLNYKLVKLGGDPSIPAPFKLSELAYIDKSARVEDVGTEASRADAPHTEQASPERKKPERTKQAPAKPEPSVREQPMQTDTPTPRQTSTVPAVMSDIKPGKKHSRSRHKSEKPKTADRTKPSEASPQASVNALIEAASELPAPTDPPTHSTGKNKKHRRRRPRSDRQSTTAGVQASTETVTEVIGNE